MTSTNHHIEVKFIPAEETYSVRHPILRQAYPIESCIFDGDDLDSSLHLGLFVKEELVGVASFMNNHNDSFIEINQYQLRGMAILKNHQSQGLGHHLIKVGEKILRDKNVNLLWFNARILAKRFYEKYDYKSIGESFEIPKVGTHYVMYKSL